MSAKVDIPSDFVSTVSANNNIFLTFSFTTRGFNKSLYLSNGLMVPFLIPNSNFAGSGVDRRLGFLCDT